ncbi:MAG: glycosyltransferase family 2 protein [Desulfurivibrionaceae bacterium]
MVQPVSVIIPTYNRRNFLEKAVNSVIDQTLANHEIIVVDDGSTDDSYDFVQSCGGQVRYIYQGNQGPAAARNAGIRAARYPLLAFLDSDDWFAPHKLETQSKVMTANPGFMISHTEEIWYRQGKYLNQKKKHRKSEGNIFADSLKICSVSMSTVMAKSRLFEMVGLFDEDLPCCEDYDFWLRVSSRFPFKKVAEALTFKEGGRPDEVSALYRLGMDKYRINSILKLLTTEKLSEEQRSLAGAELARKCRIYGRGCHKHGRPEEGDFYLELGRRAEQGSVIACSS